MGEDHPETARSYNNLGDVLYGQEKYAEAEEQHRRALAIKLTSLGEEHPSTATSRHNLAGVLHALGNDAEAEEQYRLALAVRIATLGIDHPDTAGSRKDLAEILHVRGKDAEAEELDRGAPGVASPRDQSAEVAVRINQLEESIDRLWRSGQFTDAINPAQELVRIHERYLGPDHWITADAKRDLADLRTIASLPDEGREAMATVPALVDRETKLREDAQVDEAERLNRRLVELHEKWLGPKHYRIAIYVTNLASIDEDRGDYAEAEKQQRRALAIRLATLGPSHPNIGTNHSNLGLVLMALGSYAEAEEHQRLALNIYIKARGPDHPYTLTVRSNLALALGAQGKNAAAVEQFRRVLVSDLTASGEDNRRTAHDRDNLGMALFDLGRYTEAEEQLRLALSGLLKVLREDHPRIILVRSNLAGILKEQGRYVEAEEQLRRALAVCITTLGEDHPRTSLLRNNLATTLASQDRNAEAEEQLRRALAVCIAKLGEDHPETALRLVNLGAVLQVQGKFAEAEEHHRRALAIFMARLGEDHPETSAGRNKLGEILSDQGRYAEAEEQHRRALATLSAKLGEDHPDTSSTRVKLALVLEAQGKNDEALPQWRAAAEAFDRSHMNLGPSGLERAWSAGSRSPRTALSVALARGGQNQEAWQWWEADLARGLLDDFSARQARPLTAEQRSREAELLGRLQQLDERIGRLMARSDRTQADDQQLDEDRRDWSRVRGEYLAFENVLERTYRAFAGRPSTLLQIQAALPADTALIGWADTPLQHWACIVGHQGEPVWVKIPGTGEGGDWSEDDWRRPALLRRAITSGEPTWHELAAEMARLRFEPLRPHLSRVRRLIVLPSPAMGSIPIEALLAATPDGADRLVVSYAPSGSMFARLIRPREDDAGPPRLLALGDPAFPALEQSEPEPAPPEHGLALLDVLKQSNADLNGLRAGDVLLEYDDKPIKTANDLKIVSSDAGVLTVPVKFWRNGETRALSIAAGPLGISYSTDRTAAEVVLALREGQEVSAPRTRGDSWVPLPGTRREVEAIAALFPPEQVTTLFDDQATETAVQKMATSGELTGYRFLHFATHGEADPTIAMNSSLILAPDPDRSDAEKAAVESTLETDGRITAGQIAQTWNLDADLVVLSACQTALGRQAGGEGYLGFSQALFVKGARSVVLSLWKVDDNATALLMTRFYENLLGHRKGLDGPMPRADALDEAKRWLRDLTADEVDTRLKDISRGKIHRVTQTPVPASEHPYDHPHDWAAFILIGDPN